MLQCNTGLLSTRWGKCTRYVCVDFACSPYVHSGFSSFLPHAKKHASEVNWKLELICRTVDMLVHVVVGLNVLTYSGCHLPSPYDGWARLQQTPVTLNSEKC